MPLILILFIAIFVAACTVPLRQLLRGLAITIGLFIGGCFALASLTWLLLWIFHNP